MGNFFHYLLTTWITVASEEEVFAEGKHKHLAIVYGNSKISSSLFWLIWIGKHMGHICNKYFAATVYCMILKE